MDCNLYVAYVLLTQFQSFQQIFWSIKFEDACTYTPVYPVYFTMHKFLMHNVYV